MVGINTIHKYKEVFWKKNIELQLLQKETSDVQRIVELLKKLNSEFLYPTDSEEMLYAYAEKLIENAYNFMLLDGDLDVGIQSIYANDFVTKTAFTSTFGLLPSHRGGVLAASLVKFALEFAKEVGMEMYRAEVSENNKKWLAFLMRYGFVIERETDQHSYIIVREL